MKKLYVLMAVVLSVSMLLTACAAPATAAQGHCRQPHQHGGTGCYYCTGL